MSKTDTGKFSLPGEFDVKKNAEGVNRHIYVTIQMIIQLRIFHG